MIDLKHDKNQKIKIPIVDSEGKKKKDFEILIDEDFVREDIFKKVVLAETSSTKQEQGATPLAGKKNVINLSKRRKAFRSTYGRSGSRTPKKVMWTRGTQFRYVGAFAPNTVGGRRAHPPKSEKIIIKEINNKEWFKAFKIGVLASFNPKIVLMNGSKIPKNYPIILDDEIESVSKTKNFCSILDKLEFQDEIKRCKTKKIRAGKGTMRNRKYKVKRGPLVVVSSLEKGLFKSARNILGVDIVSTNLLCVSDFSMGVKPGRATLFTESAANELVEVLK